MLSLGVDECLQVEEGVFQVMVMYGSSIEDVVPQIFGCEWF